MTRAVVSLLVLTLSGCLASSQPEDAAKEEPVSSQAGGGMEEDPEVTAYFKKQGWGFYRDSLMPGNRPIVALTVSDPKDRFEGTTLTADDYRMIARSKTAEFVDLRQANNTDAGLKAIAGMPRLTSSFVAGDGVTDAGIEAFAKSPSLERVILATKKVTDAGVKALSGLSKLRLLHCSLMTLNGSAFEAFTKSETLESLTLDYVHGFSDDGARAIARIPNLKELKIRTAFGERKLTATGIKAIVDGHLPPKFEFDAKLIDDALFESLVKKGWLYGSTPPGSLEKRPATAAEVRSISLRDSKVTDKGLRAILDCVNVQSLFLVNTGVTDETLEKMAAFEKLRWLSLEKPKIAGKGLKAVAACPIDHLALGQVPLSEAMFEAMGKMKCLKELWLGDTKMEPAWLKHLATLPKLKDLNLRYAAFDDDAVQYILTMPSIQDLTLNGTQLGDAGFLRLLKSPTLRRISVDGTKVSKAVYQKAKQEHPKVALSYFAYDR